MYIYQILTRVKFYILLCNYIHCTFLEFKNLVFLCTEFQLSFSDSFDAVLLSSIFYKFISRKLMQNSISQFII